MQFPSIPAPLPPSAAFSSGPVRPGSLLFTNAPNGILIKPVPVEFTSRGVVGPTSGWSSLDDAVGAVATLTTGDAGAAAIVRDGARYVAHALQTSWSGLRDVSLTSSVRNFGGLPIAHHAVEAFVDGAWVERLER